MLTPETVNPPKWVEIHIPLSQIFGLGKQALGEIIKVGNSYGVVVENSFDADARTGGMQVEIVGWEQCITLQYEPDPKENGGKGPTVAWVVQKDRFIERYSQDWNVISGNHPG